MGKVEKISVALPAEMAALLDRAVKSGEYASVSEVVREALRDWKRLQELRSIEIEELRRLWREGRDSGAGTKFTSERVSRIKAQGRSLLESARTAE